MFNPFIGTNKQHSRKTMIFRALCLAWEEKKNLLPATASVERLDALVGGAGGEKNFPEGVASPAGCLTAGSSEKNYQVTLGKYQHYLRIRNLVHIKPQDRNEYMTQFYETQQWKAMHECSVCKSNRCNNKSNTIAPQDKGNTMKKLHL